MLIISQGLLFGLQHSPFLHKWLSFHVQGIFHLINYWCRKCISVLTQAINRWHKEVQYLCAKCYIDDLRWHKSVVFIFLKAFPWLSAERGENICHYSFLFRYLIFIEKETWWQSDMTTCCLVPLVSRGVPRQVEIGENVKNEEWIHAFAVFILLIKMICSVIKWYIVSLCIFYMAIF